MKQLLSVILLVAMVFSVSACSVVVRVPRFNNVTSPNGIAFKVWYPVISRQKNISEFGGSSEIADNSQALLSAISYAKQNPGTKIIFDKGIYYFNSSEKLLLDGISDFELDGGGSTFIFGTPNYFVVDNASERISFKNFNVEWNFEKLRIFDLIRTVGFGASHEEGFSYTDFEFVNATEVPEENNFRTISGFNIEEKVITNDGGNLGEFVKNVEKISPNVLRVTHNFPYAIAEYNILRQYVAESQVFSLQNGSHDITIDGINILSALGYGFLINSKCYAIQFINSSIKDNPENNLFMSTTADGMHIADARGQIFVDNCEFSYMGDDCINIHQSMYEVHERVDNNKILVRNTAWYSAITIGEQIELYKPTLEKSGFTATVTGIENKNINNYPYLVLTLDNVLPAEVANYWFMASLSAKTNTYVFTNNYFHEHRARSILAEAGNGYIANNIFYKSNSSAIWITGDMFWGNLWREGVDIQNIVIENNVFESCNRYNYATWKNGVIYADALIRGGTTKIPYIKNIIIKDNIFKNTYGLAINAFSIYDFSFLKNTIDNREIENPDSDFGVFSGSGNNILVSDNTWFSSKYIRSETDAIRGRFIKKENNVVLP
ncbi:MAG: hypothetical protein DBX47_03410 [Clostridiales bacterium]|nr:MAG: hypothetical protein DBX47_03410 [Clostridiales bacterium]